VQKAKDYLDDISVKMEIMPPARASPTFCLNNQHIHKSASVLTWVLQSQTTDQTLHKASFHKFSQSKLSKEIRTQMWSTRPNPVLLKVSL